MGHLAGDHVHLVRMGGGDQHVGVTGTGAFQNVGIAGETGNPLHVERIGRPAHQIGVAVDDGHVVVFPRQMPGDLPPDLSCPANDDLHRLSRVCADRPPARMF